jgi:iron complex transport system ATP-binding protein
VSEVLLGARGLGWSARGRRIVGPLDLEIRAGECLAVVGPNGAGKSSLLRLLTGLLPPDEGEVRWRGVAYAGLSRREIARHIAYVPQERPLRVPLTVEQMVLLGRYPHLSGLRIAPRAADFEAVERALGTVGIGALRDRPIGELSGGERQAVYIAAALAQETELLVLDEPTTHLDPCHQREIAALVLKLSRDGCQTVVVATHDLNFASLIAHRVLALKRGSILALDAPARLMRRELLAELFGADFEIVRGGEHPVTVLDLGA